MDKRYAYFFTRQDISPEQQIVQTAHAALKLGYYAKHNEVEFEIQNPDKTYVPVDPDSTYFTVVGVRNLEGLEAVEQILHAFKFKYEVFVEPDMNNEMTSIALYPVNEDDRGVLMAFNLLRVSR